MRLAQDILENYIGVESDTEEQSGRSRIWFQRKIAHVTLLQVRQTSASLGMQEPHRTISTASPACRRSGGRGPRR
jgi:hypothetical protein